MRLSPGIQLTVFKGAEARSGVRDARIHGRIGHTVADGYDGPLVIGGSLRLPHGVSFHGDDLPTCSKRTLRVEQSTSGCPRRSVLGAIGPGARAFDEGSAAVVDGFTDPVYELVNGGPRRILALMTVFNPALVRAPVELQLRELRASKWSHRIDFQIPKALLVIAGVSTRVRSFGVELDGIARAPGYLSFDRRCPRRGYVAYRAGLSFQHGDGTISESSRRGRMRCRVAAKRERCATDGCIPTLPYRAARAPTQ